MFDIKHLFLCVAAGIFLSLLSAAESAPAEVKNFSYGRKKRTVTVRLPGDVELRMMKVKAGSFIMGSPENEVGRISQEKQHRVVISRRFWLGRYEVTQGQWRAVMGDNPSYFKDGDNYPVEQVSWDEAVKFCDRLNELYAKELPSGYRFDLPTEAEWEYACRAGTTTALNNGKDLTSERGYFPDLDEVAWYFRNSGKSTHPVGEKRPNAWGLYDMHGNVWEWCRDSYVSYRGNGELEVDPVKVLISSTCVDRGGGWDDDAKYCRSAFRNRSYSGRKYYFRGFRVALAPIRKKERSPEGSEHDRASEANILASVENLHREDGFTIFEETVALIPDSPRLKEIKDALADYAAGRIRRGVNAEDGFSLYQKTAAAIPGHPKLGEVKEALADYAVGMIRMGLDIEDGFDVYKKTAAAIPDHPKLGEVKNALTDWAVKKIWQSEKIKDGIAVYKKTVAAIPDHPKLGEVKNALTDYAVWKARKSPSYDKGLAILDKTIAALPDYPKLKKERSALAEEKSVAKKIEEKISIASRSASKEEELEKLRGVAKEYPNYPHLQKKVLDLVEEKEQYLAECKLVQEAMRKAKDPQNRTEAYDILDEVIKKYPKNEYTKEARAYLQELVQKNRVVIRQLKIDEGDGQPQVLIWVKSYWDVYIFPMDRKAEVQKYTGMMRKISENQLKIAENNRELEHVNDGLEYDALVRGGAKAVAERAGKEMHLKFDNLVQAIGMEKYIAQTFAWTKKLREEAIRAHSDVSMANLRWVRFKSNQCRLTNISGPVIIFAFREAEVSGTRIYQTKYAEYVPPAPKELILE